MSDSSSINVAAIEAKQTQREAKELIASQVMSATRLTEDLESAFNPAAALRMSQRRDRFRPLESRSAKASESKDKKILEVSKKGEDDLADGYNKRNPELPKERLREMRSQIREGASADEILETVDRFFKDPTLADEALEYLSKSTSGDLQSSVLRAKELLNEQKGREIIAGRNVDAAAKAYAEKGTGATPTELRDLYRDITGTPRDHNLLFEELSKQYDFTSLKMVVAFLLKGLGFDLKSKGPSIQQAELIRLLTEVRNLQSILWVYLFFKGRMRLIQRELKKYKIPGKNLTFELLAKGYIKLVEERYPSLTKVLQFAEKLGLRELPTRIVILTQFRDATRQLAPRLYKTPKQRQDLLLVLIETLEELEEKLEELEENPEEGKEE